MPPGPCCVLRVPQDTTPTRQTSSSASKRTPSHLDRRAPAYTHIHGRPGLRAARERKRWSRARLIPLTSRFTMSVPFSLHQSPSIISCSWRYLLVHMGHARVQGAPSPHAALHPTLHRRRLLYQRGRGRLAVCYPVSTSPSPQPLRLSISRAIALRTRAVPSGQRSAPYDPG